MRKVVPTSATANHVTKSFSISVYCGRQDGRLLANYTNQGQIKGFLLTTATALEVMISAGDNTAR